MRLDNPAKYSPDLVIFDCDGVLVDSERLANQVFAQILLEECGLQFSLQEMFDHFVGRSMDQCWQLVTEMLGKDAPLTLKQRYHHETIAALAESVQPVKGIESVLKKLDRLEIPYCVASSGSYEKMQTTLGKTGLINYFHERLFSTSEVKNGKPHPDIFIFAAEKMRLQPEHCLVVEDSPAGIMAAKAAGMTVFGYAELMNPQKLLQAGADSVFDDMSQLSRYLNDLPCDQKVSA